jgi:hypothetical protein
MASTGSNMIMRFFHGKMGNMILRVVGKLTQMYPAPTLKHIIWSQEQKLNRLRFKNGAAWAEIAMEDPEVRKYYEGLSKNIKKRKKKMVTARNIAVSNYLRPPAIKAVHILSYRGQKGDVIKADIVNKYKITLVIFRICDATGSEVESGMAVQVPPEFFWCYEAKETNPQWKGGRVEVQVSDLPGHVIISTTDFQ